jgi:hypothetical protein
MDNDVYASLQAAVAVASVDTPPHPLATTNVDAVKKIGQLVAKRLFPVFFAKGGARGVFTVDEYQDMRALLILKATLLALGAEDRALDVMFREEAAHAMFERLTI